MSWNVMEPDGLTQPTQPTQQLQAARAAAERWKAKYMELKDKESAQPKAPGSWIPDSAELRVSKKYGEDRDLKN